MSGAHPVAWPRCTDDSEHREIGEIRRGDFQTRIGKITRGHSRRQIGRSEEDFCRVVVMSGLTAWRENEPASADDFEHRESS
jgi:hypothetical protein